MAEKTIIRKPCRKCGVPMDIDVTEDLEIAERQWKAGTPAKTKAEILASSVEHDLCPGEVRVEARKRRLVSRVFVYEVPEGAETEEIPVAAVEQFLDVYERGLGAPESDAGVGVGTTTLLGAFRVETAATTAGEAIVLMSESLSEHWNRLAGTIGFSETEIRTEHDEEGEEDERSAATGG